MLSVTIETAYNSALSKNVWHGVNTKSKKKIYSNPKTQAEIDAISWELKRVRAQDLDWDDQRKIRVDIMIYRSNLKLDPQNVVDTICDGVKAGINVDDNIYSGSWDWELVKKGKERIVITISQESMMTNKEKLKYAFENELLVSINDGAILFAMEKEPVRVYDWLEIECIVGPQGIEPQEADDIVHWPRPCRSLSYVNVKDVVVCSEN